LLAVAKTSRPILKNAQRSYTVKVRLDYARKQRFTLKTNKK